MSDVVIGGYPLAAAFPWTALPDIVITRPNNATAYVAGGAFGAAADARVQLTGLTGNPVAALRVIGIKNRVATAAQTPLSLMCFSAQPAAAPGDQVQVSLSDADIALLTLFGSGNVGNISMAIGGSASAQLDAAKCAGLALQTNPNWAGLTSVWIIPWTTGGYVPIAFEQVTLRFFVQYAR